MSTRLDRRATAGFRGHMHRQNDSLHYTEPLPLSHGESDEMQISSPEMQYCTPVSNLGHAGDLLR